MRTQLIAIFTLLTTICYGQAMSEKDSTSLIKEKNEQLLNYKLQLGTGGSEKKSSLDSNSNSSSEYRVDNSSDVQEEALDMHLFVRKFYQGPMHEYLSNPVGNPFADDYKSYGHFKITGRDWISTTSSNTTYPTLGSLNLINVNYNYQFSDRMRGTVGTYGGRYFYQMNPNYDFGVNGSLRFELTDNLSVITFGQYSARGNMNKVGGDNGWMFPQTNYGGVAEFKITDGFGIQSGVMRELNPMTGRWKTIPIFAPVFFRKK